MGGVLSEGVDPLEGRDKYAAARVGVKGYACFAGAVEAAGRLGSNMR